MSIVDAFDWVSWMAVLFGAAMTVVAVTVLLVFALPTLTFIAAVEKDWKSFGNAVLAWLAAFAAAVLLVWVCSHIEADAPWRWKA